MHEASFFADPRSWVAVAFVIFFGLFGKRLWVAFASMLDKRADAIRGELAEAHRLREEAEELLADARSRRQSAIEDARKLLEGAKAEAARLAQAAETEAEAYAARREQMALDRIASAEKAAVDEVRQTAAEIAATAAERVIRDRLTPEADASLVDHAIARLPATLASRRVA